jgi:hypothetical protein
MASGMGMGPGPGQGSWPSQPQPQPQTPYQQQHPGGPQYPAHGYQGAPQQPQPQPVPAGSRYSAGGRFAVAEPFDGVNPDGTPRIMRAQLDPREIPALQSYLTQAPVVLAAPGNAQDELVPSAGQIIPRAFHSDGVWVWPASVGYYLACYQLPPSDALLAHIRMRNYQLGFVDQPTRSAAASELMAILNAPPMPAPAQLPPLPPPNSLPGRPAPTPQLPAPPLSSPPSAQAVAPTLPMPSPSQAAAPTMLESPVSQPLSPPVPTPVPAAIVAPAPVADPPGSRAPVRPQPDGASRPGAAANSGAAGPGAAVPAGPTMVFSATEAMAQWASLDSSPPQAGPPLESARLGAQFTAAGNRHAAWVSEQIEAFTASLPAGDWPIDHDTRRYTRSGRSFLVDGLGTLSPEGVWTWAWSEFGDWDQECGVLDQSRVLRSLAEREQIAELTSGSVDLARAAAAEDRKAAAELLVWTAMGLLAARGYIEHVSKTGGRIYYLVTDPTVPPAEPSLGSIARHLFDGTAKFGQDAADCVTGYAEHHGWEWNRTGDRVEVAATGVGSFTAEIAGGRLVGLSLHV